MLTRLQSPTDLSSSTTFSHLINAVLVFLALCWLIQVPVFAASGQGEDYSDHFQEVIDPAIAWFHSQEGATTGFKRGHSRGIFDTPVTLHHLIPLPGGAHLAVQETFTLRSWFRRPARGVMFLSGSVFRGDHWRIPVEGYNGPEMAAKRGFFAYTVDYLGVGNSSRPEDGFEVTRDANREAIRVALHYIRFFRPVRRIDLVGEGYGGSIATELGARPNLVRSVSGASMIYNVTSGGPLTDPNFIQQLLDSPTGYFFTPGEASLIFMADAPQAAQDYVAATQGGLYPVFNFLTGAELPNLDPSVARVPGLIIHGDRDFIAPDDDIRLLADDFGTDGAHYVSRPDAGHAPRIESPEIAAWFWETIFDFLENPNFPQ